MNLLRRAVLPLAALALALAGALPASAATPTPGTPPALDYAHKLVGTKAPHGNPALRGGGYSTLSACGSPCFKYATANQTVTSDGATVTAPVDKPTLVSGDYHSLFELSVQDGGNVIEVGWNVDPTVNAGDLNPHLFVGAWVGGAFQGYNAQFVPAGGATYTAGQSLASLIGTSKSLGIWHTGTAWWVLYDGTYVGAFPDSLWTGAGQTFTQGAVVQAFGELALANDPSQTDMGSSILATTSAGSLVDSYGLYNGSASASLGLGVVTQSLRWNAALVSATSFRYGGPGGNEDIYDCSGVGLGYGQVCFYSNTSGGVPINMQTTRDGTIARNVCQPNMGSADPGGKTIRVAVNTTYVQWKWYNTANCTGTPVNINYGLNVFSGTYSAPAHASTLRTSTVIH